MTNLRLGDRAYVKEPFSDVAEGRIIELSDKVTLRLIGKDKEVQAPYNQVWLTNSNSTLLS